MHIKVLHDGFAYAKSRTIEKAVQFLPIRFNYDRYRDSLEDFPLPKVNEFFPNLEDCQSIPL